MHFPSFQKKYQQCLKLCTDFPRYQRLQLKVSLQTHIFLIKYFLNLIFYVRIPFTAPLHAWFFISPKEVIKNHKGDVEFLSCFSRLK